MSPTHLSNTAFGQSGLAAGGIKTTVSIRSAKFQFKNNLVIFRIRMANRILICIEHLICIGDSTESYLVIVLAPWFDDPTFWSASRGELNKPPASSL